MQGTGLQFYTTPVRPSARQQATVTNDCYEFEVYRPLLSNIYGLVFQTICKMPYSLLNLVIVLEMIRHLLSPLCISL